MWYIRTLAAIAIGKDGQPRNIHSIFIIEIADNPIGERKGN